MNRPDAMCAGPALLLCVLFSQSPVWAAEAQGEPRSSTTVSSSHEAERYPASSQPARGQLALTVGVPISSGDDFVHGELTVDFRYGYKFWWLVPYVSGGFRQSRLDPLGWPWEARMRKLRAWHGTLGVRMEFPASRKLLPFIGIAAERDTWAYTEDSTAYCRESYYPAHWRCYQAWDWKSGHAVKPQVGLLYVPEPSLALEFWLEYVHVMAPDMFEQSIGFFHPALGIAWHH
jgi:hypothetical protein